MNKGQTGASAKFITHADGYAVHLADSGALEALYGTGEIHMRLSGADRNVPAVGINPLAGHANYLFGSDPSHWLTNVPTFGKVTYPQVYPGIDLTYYGSHQQLESIGRAHV